MTNLFISDETFNFIKSLDKEKFLIQDKNWYGGIWPLDDFIFAENIIKNFAKKYDNFSPLEKYALSYNFVTNKIYSKPPNDSSFQIAKSYVDCLADKYIVCVGYATVLKRLCDEFKIPCYVQLCFSVDNNGKKYNHANNLVLIDDKKYSVCGLFYSDARMDSRFFANDGKPCFNSFLIPPKFVDAINISCYENPTRIIPNDFKGFYFSNNKNNSDIKLLSQKLNLSPEEIVSLKNSGNFDICKLNLLLKNLQPYLKCSTQEIISNYKKRNDIFFAHKKNKLDAQNSLVSLTKSMKNIPITFDEKDETFNCSTFISFLFMHELGIDISRGGFGKGLTAKIMSGDYGQNLTIDEKCSKEEKMTFIKNYAEIGDILFFHNQSFSDSKPSSTNYYPGHVGLYIGNGKYIDARARRGNVDEVDLENDEYFTRFVGIKKILNSIFIKNNNFQKTDDDKEKE